MSAPQAATQISRSKAFSADILRFEHTSPSLGNTRTTFSVILPPVENPPALFWLSGLTCTDENFIVKAAGAQHAVKHSVAIICPDTSPRGANAPHEDDCWDFGTGAGFYVDATAPGFECYQMATYIVEELPRIVAATLPAICMERRAVSGHSMGGMGALSLALRNPGNFRSVSAFAPIANPSECGWGQKCFEGYLGKDRKSWDLYSPTKLILDTDGSAFDCIMIDQGVADEYLKDQLLTPAFVEACAKVGQKVELNMAEGYDHSYLFVQTFLGNHIAFHAKALHM